MINTEADELLVLQQNIECRQKLISELLADGVPKTKLEAELLVQLLDGSDRTVLSKMKLKTLNKEQDNLAKASLMIAEVLRRTTASKPSARRIETPTLSNDILTPELIEGELDIGVRTFSYDDIMKA